MIQMFKKIFGTAGERKIKQMLPVVEQINSLEPKFEALSDEELRACTDQYRERLAQGEAVEDLLPEAFATVREAARRVLGQRHYDVQLMGGIILNNGNIAEMRTGEGKTLVSTLPTYLNALTGKSVHVVTVNDYLARRDAEWMGRVHRFLGLTVGVVVHGISDEERKQSYASDITYGTNNEFGFDYLRDNMKFNLDSCSQRDLSFAVVDEVDSILIDEARTPLIISGPSEDDVSKYGVADKVIPRLKSGEKGDAAKGIEETGDYWVDEKAHQATLTEHGVHTVEGLLKVENLYDPAAMPLLHAVSQALIAHTLKKLDVDYVVKPGEDGGKEVMIVDEFTGRLMPGRRWSDGLHQAVEAKEGIKVQGENQTLASITFQNYFRMYEKLSGMTGTADTEAHEFASTYDLDVVVVPTNQPILRDDLPDLIYKSREEKFNAVIEDVRDCHERGQPVLVGTISIETSEMLSRKLSKFGIKHNVLNAKQHEKEAEIVAQAGQKGGVTIATNMAGRGTDIVLGGNAESLALAKCQNDPEHSEYEKTLAEFEEKFAQAREDVVEAGGLHIIGTERHESRRIDNQLRGRSGRQGDPGSTRFYLSLEDDLMRIFGSDRIVPWMERLGLEEGEAIEHRMITKAIEGAQEKVEARNFDSRKHVLEYDDVMNKQRQAFYGQRRFVQGLETEDLHAELLEVVEGVLVDLLGMHWPAKGVPEGAVAAEIAESITAQFGVRIAVDSEFFAEDKIADRDTFGRAVFEHLEETLSEKRERCAEYAEKYVELNYPQLERFERDILMSTLDRLWKDHLLTMDGLKEAIGLRGYGQRDPKMEYKREGFGLFEDMNRRIDQQVSEVLFKFTLPEPVAATPPPRQTPATSSRQASLFGGPAAKPGVPPKKVGRNEPCPCGSGKKFKKCHGAA